MKNKNVWLVILVATALAVLGCDDGSTEGNKPNDNTNPDSETYIEFEYSDMKTSGNFKYAEYTKYKYKYKLAYGLLIPDPDTKEYIDSGITILRYTGNETSVTIPAQIDGKPVTDIRGYNLIAGYQLNAVSIGAFEDCESVESVIIPDSVIRIGKSEYQDGPYTPSFVFDDDKDYASEWGGSGGVFTGCTSLTSITIPNSVTHIGRRVFYGCTSLTSITIPNSVTEIGDAAFSYCSNLASITIPNSVTIIGRNLREDDGTFRVLETGVVFSGCTSLAAINVDSSNTAYSSVDGILYNKDKTDLLRYPGGKTAASFTIPNSVTTIWGSAFSYCSNLASITIPNSVTIIKDSTFWGCTSLTSITIPNSITSIWGSAFHGCTSLTSVTFKGTIPSGNFIDSAFGTTLRALFYAQDPVNGTPGKYVIDSGSGEWTKYVPNVSTVEGVYSLYGSSVRIAIAFASVPPYLFAYSGDVYGTWTLSGNTITTNGYANAPTSFTVIDEDTLLDVNGKRWEREHF